VGLGIDERFARNDTTGRTYFLTDALNSTLALTNSSGAIQNTYSYDPYGNASQSGSGFTNPYQYTGREADTAGLYYYRARYYSPMTGSSSVKKGMKFQMLLQHQRQVLSPMLRRSHICPHRHLLQRR
jgi:hypothetical protein